MMSRGRGGGRRGFGGRNGSGFSRPNFSSELQAILHQTLSSDTPAVFLFIFYFCMIYLFNHLISISLLNLHVLGD
jgi:hypothetical protein